MNNQHSFWSMTKYSKAAIRPLLWTANATLFVAVLALQFASSPLMASPDEHYMIDDDNLGESYWSSSMPPSGTKLYETTLPNFFGEAEKQGPKVSISIQQMNENTSPALTDDEKQSIIKPFEGDPLDRKALVIEVPFQ